MWGGNATPEMLFFRCRHPHTHRQTYTHTAHTHRTHTYLLASSISSSNMLLILRAHVEDRAQHTPFPSLWSPPLPFPRSTPTALLGCLRQQPGNTTTTTTATTPKAHIRSPFVCISHLAPLPLAPLPHPPLHSLSSASGTEGVGVR